MIPGGGLVFLLIKGPNSYFPLSAFQLFSIWRAMTS
jgi:hypothetical protein